MENATHNSTSFTFVIHSLQDLDFKERYGYLKRNLKLEDPLHYWECKIPLLLMQLLVSSFETQRIRNLFT